MTECSLRISKFKSNALLQRKQFLIEVSHPNSGTVPKESIREQLAKIYKVNDMKKIVVGDFATKFGGGVTHGFGRIYDTSAAALKFERNYRLVRMGIVEAQKAPVTRGLKKRIRNDRKKVRGTAKSSVSGAKK
ncbi:40S ribosomal protein S24 [Gregarina niphandrodes]|uniref:40S ribosomal protein S24 n=1 Tax=Gregarina niphandrodes TaxID=110365 RepID=A0A023AZJ5_GRENI|nr:40S ribosomal protein S24 [Gregarina niphandrodes]EZG44264.1 40S ribosomal protein S24 [Gregarina niphandrodes]|eukprot:XP_011132738.1 40S ribosomal protein S24 [Gregarina niphandrodes]